jgi:hypothetical protein
MSLDVVVYEKLDHISCRIVPVDRINNLCVKTVKRLQIVYRVVNCLMWE